MPLGNTLRSPLTFVDALRPCGASQSIKLRYPFTNLKGSAASLEQRSWFKRSRPTKTVTTKRSSRGDSIAEIKGHGWENAEVWRYYLGEGDDGILDIGAHQGNWHVIRRMKVSVVVKQPDGKPVSDATITMIPAYSYNEPQSFVSLQQRTNDQGRYDFFPLEVGDFVLYVAKPGFLPGSAAFRVNNGEEKAIDIELKVAPPFEFFPWLKKPTSN